MFDCATNNESAGVSGATPTLIKNAGKRAVTSITLFDLPGRIQDKIMPEPMSGCWLWIANTHKDGYGFVRTGNGGPHDLAHRVTYRALVGPIPDDLELDHLCRTRPCVNPVHLEAITHTENCRRGLVNQNKDKLFCVNGHPLFGDNLATYLWLGKTKRKCRTCAREWARERYNSLKQQTGRKS